MKPITDEIILSLIERAERRQKAAVPANDSGPLSKRILDITHPEGGRIISLDLARRSARARQTVSGLFFYAPRA